MSSLVNPVKAKIASGGAALGMGVRLSRSPDVARIAKASGHDFIFIDVQHSIFNLETIGFMAQTAMEIGIAPVARVRGVLDQDVPLLLDNGVTGIVFPDVNTAEEARHCVNVTRFGPLGRRSVTGGYPHWNFRPTPGSAAQLNAATLVVCMIETPEGVRNVEQIAAVPGIDVIHIGMNDLLTNMGKPGQYDDPELRAAVDRIFAACHANGIAPGCGGNRNVAGQVEIIRRGARFLTTQTDIGFLLAAATQWTQGIAEGLK
jgi:2-keto-3-deoxy-L-rhamnonate aldolase RhmA